MGNSDGRQWGELHGRRHRRLLTSNEAGVRALAASTLAGLASDAAGEAMCEVLESDDSAVAQWAAVGLRRQKPSYAAGALIDVLSAYRMRLDWKTERVMTGSLGSCETNGLSRRWWCRQRDQSVRSGGRRSGVWLG